MLVRLSRSWLIGLAAIPALYLVHLMLLEFYAHLLVRLDIASATGKQD